MENRYTKNIDTTVGNYMRAIVKGEDIDDADPYKDIILNEDITEEIDPEEEFKPDIDDIPTDDSPYMENDDEYIGQHIPLPKGGKLIDATVIKRKRRHDGTLIGTYDSNPILDSRIYEVQFPDGSLADYSTNVLIENIYSQVDDEGFFMMNC